MAKSTYYYLRSFVVQTLCCSGFEQACSFIRGLTVLINVLVLTTSRPVTMLTPSRKGQQNVAIDLN
jgi:hypothetical protein